MKCTNYTYNKSTMQLCNSISLIILFIHVILQLFLFISTQTLSFCFWKLLKALITRIAHYQLIHSENHRYRLQSSVFTTRMRHRRDSASNCSSLRSAKWTTGGVSGTFAKGCFWPTIAIPTAGESHTFLAEFLAENGDVVGMLRLLGCASPLNVLRASKDSN